MTANDYFHRINTFNLVKELWKMLIIRIILSSQQFKNPKIASFTITNSKSICGASKCLTNAWKSDANNESIIKIVFPLFAIDSSLRL